MTDRPDNERKTDTAMHEEILGPSLDEPLPEEILAVLRAEAERKGLNPNLIER